MPRDGRYRYSRNIILKKTEGKCWYYGSLLASDWHVDHQIPVSLGGTNDPENLVPSCPKCNNNKSNLALDDYRDAVSLNSNLKLNLSQVREMKRLDAEEGKSLAPVQFWGEVTIIDSPVPVPQDVIRTFTETWKDIPGFEGRYQASSLGHIQSLPHVVRNTRWHESGTRLSPGKALKCGFSRAGYRVVGIVTDGKTTKFEAHVLIALAFLGPRPLDHHVHHINHDKTDNRVENLEYIRHSEHARYHHHGEGSGNAKLTAQDVREIRDLLAHGVWTQAEIGDIYGVCQVNISGIKIGRCWAND